jgi:hypothetical protein
MKSTKYTITTTRQAIAPIRSNYRAIYLHVIGNGIVYLGGETVTSADGTATEKGAVPFELHIPAGETVYAIVASSTEDLRVLDSSN